MSAMEEWMKGQTYPDLFEAWNAALDLAAKEICLDCRNGIGVEDLDGVPWHYLKGEGSVYSSRCRAAAILALKEGEGK